MVIDSKWLDQGGGGKDEERVQCFYKVYQFGTSVVVIVWHQLCTSGTLFVGIML